jgi:hypothetical protein
MLIRCSCAPYLAQMLSFIHHTLPSQPRQPYYGNVVPFCKGEALVSSERSGCTWSRDPILTDVAHLVLCCSPGEFVVGYRLGGLSGCSSSGNGRNQSDELMKLYHYTSTSSLLFEQCLPNPALSLHRPQPPLCLSITPNPALSLHQPLFCSIHSRACSSQHLSRPSADSDFRSSRSPAGLARCSPST